MKFKAGGKNYRVLVIPDNLPKNNFKLGSLKCKNGIYYTERKDNLDVMEFIYLIRILGYLKIFITL